MTKTLRRCITAVLVLFPLCALAQTYDFRAWIDSPEAYFATNAEREAWKKSVLTQADADRFIAEYWNKRGEQFKKDVRARIEAADQKFSLQDIPGAKTPKGRVWILLGSPSREQTDDRGSTEILGFGETRSIGQNNSVERGAIQTQRWIYKHDRLPKEIAMPEFVVRFQTDTGRGRQVIENIGQVEPYLHKVAEYYASHLATSVAAATPAPVATTTVAATVPQAEDPLWKATENLAGAFFDADSYISATEKPFYAVNFYLPQTAKAFADVKSVLLVGLVKDATGKQVAAIREPVQLKNYGSSSDRYVDHSFQLPPGKYSGAFALFTPEGTTMLANRHADFTVPAPTETTVSQLLPSAQVETFDKQLPFDPFTFVATKYAVKGDHHFTAKDKISFFTIISNPAGDQNPQLTMGVKILRDGKVLHRLPPEPASLTQTGPHTFLVGPAFDPGTFEAGQYQIEVQLKDLNAPKEADGSIKSYTARADFKVE
jgi:GWxTD domain-containing protein